MVYPETMMALRTKARLAHSFGTMAGCERHSGIRNGGTDSGEDWVDQARVRVAAHIQEGIIRMDLATSWQDVSLGTAGVIGITVALFHNTRR